MKRHATALRAFSHADDRFAKKQTILDMDAGLFADWSAPGVDLVREATAAEIAAARGEKPATRPKAPAKPRKATARKPRVPAVPVQVLAPPAAEPLGDA